MFGYSKHIAYTIKWNTLFVPKAEQSVFSWSIFSWMLKNKIDVRFYFQLMLELVFSVAVEESSVTLFQ